MKIEEILMKHFNWTEDDIQKKAKSIQYISCITNEKLALRKAEFYKKEFKLKINIIYVRIYMVI